MKRKIQSKLSKKVISSSAVTEYLPSESAVKRGLSKKVVLLLALVLFASLGVLFAKKYKSLFIVGKVNGQVVSRWELEKAMNDRYASTTFDDLASTTLLKQQTKKNDVTVSKDELEKEIAATEQRLGGKEALQSTLDRLGYSQSRFEEEMRTQVMVRKLAEKLFKIEVTDQEVEKFYNDNKTLFPDKKLADVKLDIFQNLTEQKLQQQFTTWFQEEKGKATIQSYL